MIWLEGKQLNYWSDTMYKILSFISEETILSEYKDHQDLESSYGDYVDGIELIQCGFDGHKHIRNEKVIGVHLPFYSDWLSFWLNNKAILMREFGSSKTWESFYGSSNPEILISFFQQEMDYAQEIGAKYVVFHVSNVTISETYSFDFDYSDEEVIDATISLINILMAGKQYSFELLLENLPWPGLNFTSSRLAKKLVDGIHYENVGFMLDTGHMMTTNWNIKSSEDGINYIYNWFQQNFELIPYVRGIHLHQSIVGDYLRNNLNNPIPFEADFYKRFAQAYEHVLKIDQHDILDSKQGKKLIDFLSPKYLVYEFRSTNRKEREEKLKQQDQILYPD